MLAFATCTALVFSTVAWFSNLKHYAFDGGNTPQINAGSEASPYGGGSGTIDKPYIISNRRHLYNLAWKQYMGDYNKTSIQQLYFKVTKPIDMKGVTLPPIGTNQYPFLGHFDGNNQIISNVTISNDNPLLDTSDFGVMKPSSDLLEGTTPPTIVGFFGVVGQITGSGLTYNTTIVGMTNFTLDTIKVTSKTSQTLMGLAAGYVNGSMSGVKIDGTATLDVDGQTSTAAISSITNKISDYGLVGYTENTTRAGTFSQDLSGYYESEDDEGGGSDWGGSIAIEEIFNRITTIRNTYANNTSALLRQTNIYRNGVQVDTETASANFYQYNQTIYRTSEDEPNYNASRGAFQFYPIDSNNKSIYCLSGGHLVESAEQNYHQYTPITDGTNYLCASRSGTGYGATVSLLNRTSEDNCTFWTYTIGGTGRITINDARKEFTSQYGGQSTYYLTITGGTLALTTNSGSAVNWTITDNNGVLSIVSGLYHLIFDGSWKVVEEEPSKYYTIRDNASTRHYFALSSGTNLKPTTNSSDQVTWYYDSASQGYYTIINGVVRYLTITNSGNRYATTTTTTDRILKLSTGTAAGTGNLTAVSGGRTYYLYYANSNENGWRSQRSSGDTFVVEEHNNPNQQQVTDNVVYHLSDYWGPDYTVGENDYHMDFSGQDVTYFPLNINDDDLTVADSNTGYVVGGSNYNKGVTSFSTNTDGTVRVADYYTLSNDIKNAQKTTTQVDGHDVTTVTLNNVLTIDGGGNHTINETTNTYQRYADAKKKTENILTKHCDEDKVYGLHFMQNSISKQNLVTALSAKINGVPHTNYQLPASSIDFNLKERGFISFFAGSYGIRSVDSFFSLHLVRRDADGDITNIYEIEKILSDGNQDHSYVYKLKDLGYTVPYSYNLENQSIKYVLNTKTPLSDFPDTYPDGEYTTTTDAPSNYNEIFDTAWIKERSTSSITQKNMYYFEIPVNCGEFCLGSVENGDFGAYLVYLDIGAFDRDEDKITGYHVTTFANSLPYPNGVDFAVASATGIGGETMCISLPAKITGNGSVSFVVSSETSNIAITDANSLSTYSYKGTKYSADPGDGKFTVSGNLPGALVVPSEGGDRLLHIKIEAVDHSIWHIEILDRLDDEGEVESSTYQRIVKDGTPKQEADIPTSLTATILGYIRALTTVVTFTREEGTADFDTTATYDKDDDEEYKIVNATITSSDSNFSSLKIEVSNLADGYIVYLNGGEDPAANDDIYPPQTSQG